MNGAPATRAAQAAALVQWRATGWNHYRGNGSTPLSMCLAPRRPPTPSRGIRPPRMPSRARAELPAHTRHTMEIDRTWVLPLVSTYTV